MTLNPGAKFCKSCGKALEVPQASPRPALVQPQYAVHTQKQKRKGGWLIPYRIAAVLLVVVLGVNAYKTAIIDPYYRDLNRDYALDTDYYTPPAEPEYPVFISDYADHLAETGGIDYAMYYAPLEAEGDSKAFRITPLEGLTISAEENALDRDRSWNVREATAEEAGP